MLGACRALSEVIWRQIATSMTVKEYAQMSGTCKVFSELCPDASSLCVDQNMREGR